MAYPAREGKAVAEPPRSEGREWSRNRSQSYVLPCELEATSEGGECQGNRLRELAEYVQFSTNLHFAHPWEGVEQEGGQAEVFSLMTSLTHRYGTSLTLLVRRKCQQEGEGMPWKRVQMSEERIRFVIEASKPRSCMAALCGEFGISRQAGDQIGR